MTTNEIIEPIVEETPPRDLNVLLALETYQGMTDDEIEMIFDYRLGIAMKSAEAKAISENAQMARDRANEIQYRMLEESRKAQAKLFEMLESRDEIKMVVNIPEEITPPNLVNLSEADSNG